MATEASTYRKKIMISSVMFFLRAPQLVRS
jgi:hypothetical protein